MGRDMPKQSCSNARHGSDTMRPLATSGPTAIEPMPVNRPKSWQSGNRREASSIFESADPASFELNYSPRNAKSGRSPRKRGPGFRKRSRCASPPCGLLSLTPP